MKTTIKYIIAGIPLIAISILISHCKSPGVSKETSASTTTDTILVVANKAAEAAETAVDSKKLNDTAVTDEIKTVATIKPLTVVIQNLKSSTAPVYISIYGTQNKFPEPKGQLKEYKFKPHGKELTVQIPNLKFGTYALASYQDVNSDGKIDKNLIGIPTEGYAFSNNYKPTIKAPNFDDCSFEYNAKTNSVTMKMIP